MVAASFRTCAVRFVDEQGRAGLDLRSPNRIANLRIEDGVTTSDQSLTEASPEVIP